MATRYVPIRPPNSARRSRKRSDLSQAIFLSGLSVGLWLALCIVAWADQTTTQLILTDPAWYEEPDSHNTFPPADLTELRVVNGPDSLWVDIPFQSSWLGLQLHVLLETNFDTAGAVSDPFWQPVNYAHTLKPDYAIT